MLMFMNKATIIMAADAQIVRKEKPSSSLLGILH